MATVGVKGLTAVSLCTSVCLCVGVYSCPAYYYPRRTGTRERPSFIVAVDLKSGEKSPEHWTKRGTALLMSLDVWLSDTFRMSGELDQQSPHCVVPLEWRFSAEFVFEFILLQHSVDALEPLRSVPFEHFWCSVWLLSLHRRIGLSVVFDSASFLKTPNSCSRN